MSSTRSLVFSFVGLLLLALALGACASPTPDTVVVTQMVEGTPQTIVITATPEPAAPAVAAGSVQLNGAGATFPLPVYTEWTYAYQYVDPAVAVNYQGIGSGGGKKAIVDRTVDFAGSDSLLKDEEYQAGGDLQMYPMLAGAVVPIYLIDGVTADDPVLVLSREVLVGIYDGSITTWNDPAITALNPGLAAKLPAASITAVHRSDGSGTTEIFTKALSAFSSDWANNVGAGSSVEWPVDKAGNGIGGKGNQGVAAAVQNTPNSIGYVGAGSSVEWPVDKAGNGIGGKGNQGVAAAVQNTPNSIGYVELSYAVSNNIPFAQMINKSGATVVADAASLQSAMADFAGSFDERLTTNIVDGQGAGSWPIAGYTYLILHTQSMQDCDKASALLDYIHWTLTDAGAAKRASDLGYAVLPGAVQELVLATLGEVTCNGSPVMAGG